MSVFPHNYEFCSSLPKGSGDYYTIAVVFWVVGETGCHAMVLVGLGSNEGESRAILQRAFAALEVFALQDFRRSHFYRTSPVDCVPGSNDFVNAAAAFVPLPELTPEGLLRQLKVIERNEGRGLRYLRNSPRLLDLDLLLFGAQERHTPWFQLPHARAVDRLFVLAPAAEIAPDLLWPGTGRTVAQLRRELVTQEVVQRLG